MSTPSPADAIDPSALARDLADATADRRAIPMLSSAHPALDVAAAYEVQRAGIQLRQDAGETVVGYKLGLVSRAKQEAMGVAEPLWGWLSDGMLHPEEEPLETRRLIHPRVEPEIAILLGSDLVGATASVATVLAATEAVFPALEVLDSRFEDFKFTLPDVIADNASAAKIVLGGRSLPGHLLDLQLEGMVLRCDGAVVDSAAGAAVAGHPAAAVAWLARAAGELPAGSIVLTGGLTAPVALEPGTVISAQFTNLGNLTLACAR